MASELRRDPEEFLRRAKEEEARRSRGRLKVFFGAAAGVGKTYAMLEAARQQREAGVDVVIGVVETLEAAPKVLRRQIDQLDLVGLSKHRVGIRHVVDIFGGQIAILLPDDKGHLQTRASLMSPPQLEPSDVAVAQWAYEHGRPAGAGTENLPRGQMLFVPLRASRGAVGVLGLRPSEPGTLDDAELRGVLRSFANQIGLAIERSLLATEAQRAQLRIEAERLRDSLLSSVSHDLRAPLASITDAASALGTAGDTLDAAKRRSLAASIHAEADQLHRLVSSLLDMTRLESGAVPLHREWQSLDGVVGAALGRIGGRLEGHPLSTDIPATLPLVPIDSALMEQVFFNLLDNAVKYTPEGCPIEITAAASDGALTVSVADRGPGLPPDVLEHVFEKFYRAKSATHQHGAGLGLTICRAIVSAHGGRIWAENRPGGGLVFRFTLPRPAGPPGPAGSGHDGEQPSACRDAVGGVSAQVDRSARAARD